MVESSKISEKKFKGWELGLFAPSVSQMTPSETIALLSKMDYKWVEWRVQTNEQIESSPWGKAYNTLVLEHLIQDAREISAILKGSGVKVAALQLDAPDEFPNLHSLVREAAEIMSCSKILLFSPSLDLCQGYHAQKMMFQDQIRKWVAAFAGSKTRICLETHFSSITPSSALAMGILEPFNPNETGVIWDPANMVFEGSEIPALAMDLMGSHLAEVHLKNGEWKREEDGKWNFNFCDLSQGIVNWPAVLKLLDELPYLGPLIVEDYRWTEPEAKLTQARMEYEKALASAQEIE